MGNYNPGREPEVRHAQCSVLLRTEKARVAGRWRRRQEVMSERWHRVWVVAGHVLRAWLPELGLGVFLWVG